MAAEAASRLRQHTADAEARQGGRGRAAAVGGGARRQGSKPQQPPVLCGAELVQSQVLIGGIATYLARCGATPADVAVLLEGWSAVAQRRGDSPNGGRSVDHYYYDAGGKKFRSRVQIARHFALATSRGEHWSLSEQDTDAGQRRYSALEPACVGDRVKCRWNASSKARGASPAQHAWYPGVVLAVRAESRAVVAFMVAFDDGDYDDRVLPQHMRPLSAEEVAQADAALAIDDWAQTPAREDWDRTNYLGDEYQVEVPPWAGPVPEPEGGARAEPVRVASRAIEEELCRRLAKRMTEAAGLRYASISGAALGDGRPKA